MRLASDDDGADTARLFEEGDQLVVGVVDPGRPLLGERPAGEDRPTGAGVVTGEPADALGSGEPHVGQLVHHSTLSDSMTGAPSGPLMYGLM